MNTVLLKHGLKKEAVLPLEAQHVLITRNYLPLNRAISNTPYGRLLGDEAASIVNCQTVMAARTFDPSKYRNPETRRPYRVEDVGKTAELDKHFRNYSRPSINKVLGSELRKRDGGGVSQAASAGLRVGRICDDGSDLEDVADRSVTHEQEERRAGAVAVLEEAGSHHAALENLRKVTGDDQSKAEMLLRGLARRRATNRQLFDT